MGAKSFGEFELRHEVAHIINPNIDDDTLKFYINNSTYPAQAYINQWGRRLEDFATLAEAVADFKEWFSPPKPKPQGFRLTDYLRDGNIIVSCLVTLENGAELKNTVEIDLPEENPALISAEAGVVLYRLLKVTAEKIGSNIVGHHVERTPKEPLAMNEERVFFETMSVSYDAKSGKIAKLKGGEYRQFGVPIYEEALAEVGISFEELPLGESDFNRHGVVLLREGKAKKVIRVI